MKYTFFTTAGPFDVDLDPREFAEFEKEIFTGSREATKVSLRDGSDLWIIPASVAAWRTTR